jgi:hypothetical protein
MSTSPIITIRRCQHIKVNGVQCGSPALRNEKRCFFHEQCIVRSQANLAISEPGFIQLASLEDANSIQLGLAEVMRLLVTRMIDHPTASLLLRALRTAAANVKFTSFEPKPTHVVVDQESVENRPLGTTAWSEVKGRDYDEIETDAAGNEPEVVFYRDFTPEQLKEELRKTEEAIYKGIAALPPDFLNHWRHQSHPASATRAARPSLGTNPKFVINQKFVILSEAKDLRH